MIEPGGINTRADLHAALAELHRKDPGQRSFHQFAADAGISGVATVHGMVKGTSFPRRQTLALALAAWGIPKAQHEPWFRAYERASKDNSDCLGRPLAEIIDPFELEVHRSITLTEVTGLPALPPYVRRMHDRELAEIVQRAIHGESAMAILVAGSSAGKTRTLWESLSLLRDAGEWRLWHPLAPTRHQALDDLAQVKARTVVWLNEFQEYLPGGDGAESETIAVALDRLLGDPDRAPVLVLGTLWPDHHARLCKNPASQIRKLLEGKVIAVPEAFTGQDLVTLSEIADADPRLARALKKAEDGQVTQYLAGGPELVNWYLYSSSPAARAVVDVAIDARRMGHQNALPYALLREAAPSYMASVDWDRVEENWLEQALAETSTPRKGTRGAVTRVHSTQRTVRRRRRAISALGESGVDAEPLFQLADYLDQYGRAQREGHVPPLGFWEAVARNSHPQDLIALGDSAWKLLLYRDAAQLWKNAIRYGAPLAPYRLLACLHPIHLADHRPDAWIVERADLTSALGLLELLAVLRDRAVDNHIAALLARDPAAHVHPDDPDEIAELLEVFHELGATSQVALLADRAVTGVKIDFPYTLTTLLETLHRIGARAELAALASRAAADIDFEYVDDVIELMKSMHHLHLDDQLDILIHRIVAYFERDESDVKSPSTAWQWHDWDHQAKLFRAIHAVRRDAAAIEAAEHLATQTNSYDLWDLSGFGDLLRALHDVGADAHGDKLAHLVSEIDLDFWEDAELYLERAASVAGLLQALHSLGDDDQTLRIAEQLVTDANLGDLYGADKLLATLKMIGAHQLATKLGELIVDHVERIDLRNPGEVSHYVQLLHSSGMDTALSALLMRDPVANIELLDRMATLEFAQTLHEAGEEPQLQALRDRIARHATWDDQEYLTFLLSDLAAGGSEECDPLAFVQQSGRTELSQVRDADFILSQHNFGREPDGSEAEPWTWDDLD